MPCCSFGLRFQSQIKPDLLFLELAATSTAASPSPRGANHSKIPFLGCSLPTGRTSVSLAATLEIGYPANRLLSCYDICTPFTEDLSSRNFSYSVKIQPHPVQTTSPTANQRPHSESRLPWRHACATLVPRLCHVQTSP